MYYDDESRRFNFLSGLLLGAVLGSGLVMLASQRGGLHRSRPLGSLAGFKAEAMDRFGKQQRRGQSTAREIEERIRGAVRKARKSR